MKKSRQKQKQKETRVIEHIFYTIVGGKLTKKMTGNELYRCLLERQEMNVSPAKFQILRDGLPEYVWDGLFMNADIAANNDRVHIHENSLRMFLEYLDYQYFNSSAAAEYDSFRQERLAAFDQLIWVN
jgi:sugar diacid utilization regulator